MESLGVIICGIVAIHAYGADAPRVDRGAVLRIRDAMATRGPDGSGYWESERGDVAMGHRRLAILDPSERGAQPMRDATGRFTIVFNGEIYNFRALRADLEGRGHVFRTDSDTEVLLALYRERGPAMVERLRGMYAFALWDEAERTLVLARDPYGIKPLYVADDGRTVQAASQVRALISGGGVDATLDPAGVVGFLTWGHVPEPFTLHSGIRSLAPGEVVVYRSGCAPRRIQVSSLSETVVGSQRCGSSTVLDAASLREALLESVRHHLESDVPVGLFLSAGLDSRAIARLCRDAGADVLAVTLGFSEHEGTPRDEVPLARQAAAALGIRHEAVRVTRGEFESNLDEILAAMDQPSIDGVNTWFVSRAAASLGLKVALSGLGADELFGGYPSFREVPRAARALSAFSGSPAAGRLSRRLAAPLARRASSPKWAGLLEYGGTLGGAYLLRRGLFMPWELEALLAPEVVREGWEALGTLAALEGTVSGLLSDRLRLTALESTWYMRNQLLRDSDWAGMAHSLEIRVPFVDLELTRRLTPALASATPPTKADMIRAVEPDVPDAVVFRAKSGFLPPVAEWVAARGTAHAGRGLRGWARLVLERLAPGATEMVLGSPARRSVERPVSIPGPRRRNRALISTLPPSWGGGVPRMARFAAETLCEAGFEPTLAWYRPYSEDPYLSPSMRSLGVGAIGERGSSVFDGVEGHEIGARFPELEFNHYRLSGRWLALVENADVCIAASGNCLAALPFLDSGARYLAWIATAWREDRRARESAFPILRRVADSILVRPVVEGLEKEILQQGTVLALSEHTRSSLDRIAGKPVTRDVLPVPIDLTRFRPDPAAVVPGRIGFVGRLGDPRKQVRLLIQALACAKALGADVHAVLVGGPLPSDVHDLAIREGLRDVIEVRNAVTESELPQLLRTLDVFVIPSEQEGLCIAALEAMACSVPVVSTRCGGPEKFVRNGETGHLCDHDAEQIAGAVAGLVGDREARIRMGARARSVVADEYSTDASKRVLMRYL